MPPLDISHSQPIDQSALGHIAPAAPDCSFAREIQSQVSAAVAQPMPGAESLMAAPGMPPLPGAEQTISPLIQMIMRMPGHIGLATSFFEALGNFFLPQTDMLSIFDPSHFGLHFDLSSAMPADHTSIDFSLLPHDAPLLDHLGSVDMGTAHSLDLASDKLNLSLGGHSHFVADGSSTSLSMGSQLNVSGPASLAKPQFEGAGGLVSGPSVTQNFSADSLASNNRMFSDGQTISNASHNMMIAGGNSSSVLNAQSLPQGASAVSGGNLAASNGLSSGMVDNVSAQATPANNVSYNVFEKLSGNKELLAANNVSDSYHSTIGTIQPDAPSDTVSHAAAAHPAAHTPATTGSENYGGLKAKPMSLDGSKVELKADHAKLDQTPSPKVEHAAEHKVEHTAEHKVEHAAEHKVEHTAEAKAEHAPAHHANQQIAQKLEHKPESTDVSDKAKTTANAQPAAHAAAHTAPHAAAAHHPAHIADKVSVAEAHAPAAHQAVIEPKNLAAAHQPAAAAHQAPLHQAPAHQAATQASAPQMQPQNMQAQNVQFDASQTEATQNAAAVDAQQQFGQPVNGGDASTAVQPQDAQMQGTDATHTQGAGGQTLDQQQTPVAKTYVIRSGDCLWNIAKDQMGDATKWSDLYKVNAGVLGSNPSLIHPGVSIQMPGADGIASSTGTTISHYTVKAGDNLWNIAKDQMGDATKWGDLYKANQDIIGSNPSLIQPGQELTFTSGGAETSATTLSSAAPTSGAAGHLAQAPAAAGGAAPAPHAGGDIGAVSQNSASIETYGSTPSPEMNGASIQHSSDINFDPAPMQHNIQAPQAPSMTPAKVLPVEAQPDPIIQPAHAADLSTINTATHEAASATHSIVQSQKGTMVDSSVASDLMSVLNKRR